MQLSTLAQIKTRLKDECDIYDEDFIDLTTELLGYINSAIDTCEAVIHNLYEDYFLVNTSVNLVSGTATYGLPTDIYGNKIRGLLYDDGSSRKYEVERIQRFRETLYITWPENYKFLMTNDSTNGVRLNLYPTPQETNSFLKMFYIRNAKKLAADTDSCDIPEFIDFIYAHTKWLIARKEKSTIDLANSEKELAAQKELLVNTLTDMTPDESSNRVVQDMTFYDEFYSQRI